MRSAFQYDPALLGYTVRMRVAPDAGPIGTVGRGNRRIESPGRSPVYIGYWTACSPSGQPLRRNGKIERYPHREDAARALAELIERRG